MKVEKGDRIRIDPFQEEAEVFEVLYTGDQITLGVIFLPSQKAQRFVFSSEEFQRRVQVYLRYGRLLTSGRCVIATPFYCLLRRYECDWPTRSIPTMQSVLPK